MQKQAFRFDDSRSLSLKFFFLITGSDLLFNKLDEKNTNAFLSLSPRGMDSM